MVALFQGVVGRAFGMRRSAMIAALDACQANVMLADNNLRITYINRSLERMLKTNEAEIREQLPNFNVDRLVGVNVDVFHKNPAHQRGMINKLKTAFNTKIHVGRLTLDLIATPIHGRFNRRLGTVIEWKDMTEELARRDEERRIHNENLRIRDALDNIDTNVMIANAEHNIIYMNRSLVEMLTKAEKDLRKTLPNFDVKNLIGENMDVFHKNPAHQRGLVEGLEKSHTANLRISDQVLRLIATPVLNAEGERIGTVVEWYNRTEEVRIQEDVQRVVGGAAKGEFGRRIDTDGLHGFLLSLSEEVNEFIEAVDTNISAVGTSLSAISHKDLTERAPEHFQGKFGEMARDCNNTVDSLAQMMGEIRGSAEQIANAASELSKGNADLSARTEQQAASLEETASSMEELTATVKQNTDHARRASQLSEAIGKQGTEGGEQMHQVVKTMQDIADSSKKISEIIAVIDGIAFQTNLLALNAAVEAARAGEQGRGFAVVAGEVRNLAQRATQSAKDIGQLIAASVEKIETGNALVEKTGSTIESMVAAIKEIREVNSEIAAASEEQSSDIENVSEAVHHMDEMTQQNAALVEQAAAAAESQSSEVSELEQMIRTFQLPENR